MPRLNPGVQGSPIVSTVAAKDRLTDGVPGSPVFVGTASASARKTPGAQGSPLLRGGKSWYVDTVDGDDANDGETPQTPVKNWHALQPKPIKPGDKIKVKKGSVVPVATMYADHLVIEAYGDGGADPVIESIATNGFTAPAVGAGVVLLAPAVPFSDVMEGGWTTVDGSFTSETKTSRGGFGLIGRSNLIRVVQMAYVVLSPYTPSSAMWSGQHSQMTFTSEMKTSRGIL